MTNIENGQHIIIEGSYLPPEHIWDFQSEYLEHIIPLYIGFSKNYLEKHFISGIIEHRSEIEQKDYDDYMNQEQLKELCKINDVNFFEINDDYEEEMNNVYKWIDEQVKAKQWS